MCRPPNSRLDRWLLSYSIIHSLWRCLHLDALRHLKFAWHLVKLFWAHIGSVASKVLDPDLLRHARVIIVLEVYQVLFSVHSLLVDGSHGNLVPLILVVWLGRYKFSWRWHLFFSIELLGDFTHQTLDVNLGLAVNSFIL
jgi:hypothetical protein